MNAGSSLVNYGEVYCSSITLDSRAVLEEKKGSILEVGNCNDEGYIFFAHEEDIMSKLGSSMDDRYNDIVNEFCVRLSFALSMRDTTAQKEINAMVRLIRENYLWFKAVTVKGDGKPVIVLEDDTATAHGFGDKVEIKYTEY